MPNMAAVLVDILNNIAFGAVDATIAGQLRDELDLEYADLLGLVKSVREELNRNGVEYDQALTMKSNIMNAMAGATPLGTAWNKLVQNSAKADADIERLRKEGKMLQTKSNELDERVEKLNIERGHSAGRLIADKGLPFTNSDVKSTRL